MNVSQTSQIYAFKLYTIAYVLILMDSSLVSQNIVGLYDMRLAHFLDKFW